MFDIFHSKFILQLNITILLSFNIQSVIKKGQTFELEHTQAQRIT